MPGTEVADGKPIVRFATAEEIKAEIKELLKHATKDEEALPF